MIEKHYGKYIGGNAEEQFSRLLSQQPGTFPGTEAKTLGTYHNEPAEKVEKEFGGPTWIRTLQAQNLLRLTKSREVAGEIEECVSSPLLCAFP